MTLLCSLPGGHLVRVARDGPAALTVLARARHDHSLCPTCRTRSTAVHSRYRRRAADLPASGKVVRLQLAVRRCYCREPAYPRRTFADGQGRSGAWPRVPVGRCSGPRSTPQADARPSSPVPQWHCASGRPDGRPHGPRGRPSGRRCCPRYARRSRPRRRRWRGAGSTQPPRDRDGSAPCARRSKFIRPPWLRVARIGRTTLPAAARRTTPGRP